MPLKRNTDLLRLFKQGRVERFLQAANCSAQGNECGAPEESVGPEVHNSESSGEFHYGRRPSHLCFVCCEAKWYIYIYSIHLTDSTFYNVRFMETYFT